MKHAREMNFGEIMELIGDKNEEFKKIKFKPVEEKFDSWDHFYEVHGDGATIENEGIFEQWMGIHEFTFIWRNDEKFPFAYSFPKRESEEKYTFYMREE